MPKIKELLTDESKWTKGAFARTSIDISGKGYNWCEWNDPRAVCWCVEGAIFHCYQLEDRLAILNKVAAAIYPERPHWLAGIPAWNDRIATFEDVKALIHKLDI